MNDRAIRMTMIGSFLLCAAGAGHVSAQAPPPEEPPPVPEIKRPAYSFLRQNEDWSVLRNADPAAQTDFWDPIKFVPLNEEGDIWASFGGSYRLRLENWWGFGFGAPADDEDTFLLSRLLLHADLHIGEGVRGFVQGKSALSTDRDLPGGRRTLDVDVADLEQGFMDLSFPLGEDEITVRGGRQHLAFGKQRLVSPLAWSNTLRRWDGVSLIATRNKWKLQAFWAQFVPVEKYEFNDPDAQTQLFGAYASGPLADDTGLDLYYLGLDRDDDITFNGTTGDEMRHTFGARLFGELGGTTFDYDFEGAYQFGDVGSGDVNAWMVGSQFGYTAAELWSSPRFFFGFDFATGDRSPGGDVETFNQLYPLGHAYLGNVDTIGRQNLYAFSLGASCTPFPKASLVLTGYTFYRMDTDDAVYNAGGGVVRAGILGDDREVGQEIDLVLKYKFDRHLLGELGYSHFFAGDFIEESGPSDDIDFLYVSLGYTF